MTNTEQSRLRLLEKTIGKNVSRETLDKLDEFAALLLKWNQKINLVSKKIDNNELWQRHILDSAQIIKFIPEGVNNIIDLGSGAGFPGLVLDITGGYKISLIESDQRKCAFMQEAISKFSLHSSIFNARIEAVEPFDCDLIVSRALAPLVKLIEYSAPFLKKDNFMLFLKGQNMVEEIKEASTYWNFEHEFYSGAFNKDGGVLKIFNVMRRRDEIYSK